MTEETLSVSGVLLTKTFGQQETATNRFLDVNRRLAKLQIRQAMVGRWFFMIIGTIFSITPAFVYWLAGSLAIQGDPTAPTIGDIVAFTTLQSRLFFPLGQLLNVQVEIQGSLALFDRIFEYLEMEPEIVDAPDAKPLDPRHVSGRVRLRNVSFRYPASVRPPRPPRPRPDDGGHGRGRSAARAGRRGRGRRRAVDDRPVEPAIRRRLRARGRRLRGPARASSSRSSARRARARPRPPT